MQGKSVACTLLQLFNKVSIIVQGSYSTSLWHIKFLSCRKNNSSVCSWETYVYSVFITKNQKKTNTEQVIAIV